MKCETEKAEIKPNKMKMKIGKKKRNSAWE